MIKAALYVSESGGMPVAEQEERCRQYAHEQGWAITRVLRDTDPAQPGSQGSAKGLIEASHQAGFSVLVIASPQYLDLEDHEAIDLADAGIDCVVLPRTPSPSLRPHTLVLLLAGSVIAGLGTAGLAGANGLPTSAAILVGILIGAVPASCVAWCMLRPEAPLQARDRVVIGLLLWAIAAMVMTTTQMITHPGPLPMLLAGAIGVLGPFLAVAGFAQTTPKE